MMTISTADRSTAHQVEQATGAGDEDVDTLGEGADLRVLADAAEDRQRDEVGGLLEAQEGFLDLGGELAGRGEDQRAGLLGDATLGVGGQALHHRQQEGEGLARAGATATEDVASCQGVGQRGCLDRGGAGDAAGCEDIGKGLGNAQGNEIRQVEKPIRSASCTARSAGSVQVTVRRGQRNQPARGFRSPRARGKTGRANAARLPHM